VQQYDDLYGSSTFRPGKFCRQKMKIRWSAKMTQEKETRHSWSLRLCWILLAIITCHVVSLRMDAWRNKGMKRFRKHLVSSSLVSSATRLVASRIANSYTFLPTRFHTRPCWCLGTREIWKVMLVVLRSSHCLRTSRWKSPRIEPTGGL